MILRHLSRQGLLRVAAKQTKSFSPIAQRTQIRSLHEVPELRNGASFERDGIAGFLSPKGFEFSWTNYQTLLVQNLNRLTVDTPEANLSPKELAIHTSRWSEKAAVFNYASMAFNNQFFFDGLHPDAPQPTEGKKLADIIPRELNADISNSFSSPESLREELIKTANAMFGPGFVWVMKDLAGGMLTVLTTYNAGSPFPAAHARRQPVDMNNITTNTISGRTLLPSDHNKRLTEIQNAVGTFGPFSRNSTSGPTLAPGALTDYVPILCVKVWEHGWLYDYGMGPRSKELYLERWWSAIDWNQILQRTLEHKSSSALGSLSLSGVNAALRRPAGAGRA